MRPRSCRRVTGDRLPAITNTGPSAARDGRRARGQPHFAGVVPVRAKRLRDAARPDSDQPAPPRLAARSRARSPQDRHGRVTSNRSASPLLRSMFHGPIEHVRRRVIDGIRHRPDVLQSLPLEVQPQIGFRHRRHRMTRHRMPIDAQHRSTRLGGRKQMSEHTVAPDVRLPADDRQKPARELPRTATRTATAMLPTSGALSKVEHVL